MVKNPPSNAGDAGLIPGQGTKVPHATGQLSLHTTSREQRSNKPRGSATKKVMTTKKSHNRAGKNAGKCHAHWTVNRYPRGLLAMYIQGLKNMHYLGPIHSTSTFAQI